MHPLIKLYLQLLLSVFCSLVIVAGLFFVQIQAVMLDLLKQQYHLNTLELKLYGDISSSRASVLH